MALIRLAIGRPARMPCHQTLRLRCTAVPKPGLVPPRVRTVTPKSHLPGVVPRAASSAASTNTHRNSAQ